MSKSNKRGQLGTESTLSPILTGTSVHNKRVTGIKGRDEPRRNRDVSYSGDRTERVGIPELQDHLLIEKGYLPKYSGLPLQYFIDSREIDSRLAKNLKQKQRYWDAKQEEPHD